ncbi:MAG: hypothetical protein RJA07_2426 [Bacteroidota bacterium]|jgi:hypothetical protein
MQQDNVENEGKSNEPIASYSGVKKINFYQSVAEQKEQELLHELQLTGVERWQTTVALIRKVYSKHLQMLTSSNRITFNKK